MTEVRSSFIASMNDFYVVKEKNIRLLDTITTALNTREMVEDASKFTDEMGVFKEGDVVMAKFCNDGSFFRGKIEAITKIDEKEDAKVFLIDLGNREVLPASCLLHLPPTCTLLDPAPLAIHCSLFDCEPRGKKGERSFRSLVAGHKLILHKMGRDKQTGVLSVDLLRLMGDAVDHSSVRDLLVLSRRATFQSQPGTRIPNTDDGRQFQRLENDMEVGSVHAAVLSHLQPGPAPTLPPRLYLQLLAGPALRLPRLMDRMAAVYGARRSGELWSLASWGPGTVCAALDQDRRWYRAQVQYTVAGRLLKVQYVDFGNYAVLPVHRLRCLFWEFLRLPAVAVEVSVDGVENVKWMSALKSMLNSEDLTATVLETLPEEKIPHVKIVIDELGDSIKNLLPIYVNEI